MKRNKKLIIILVAVLAVGAIATTIGLTSAYWVGASGNSEVAPQTDTTDWNYWIKYFIYEPVRNSNGGIDSMKIVGFSGAVYENVIIPRKVYGTNIKIRENGVDSTIPSISEDSPYPVTTLCNSTFADTTEKAVPVTITLPTSVTVDPGTFMGMSNLTTIKIVHVQNFNNDEVTEIDIGGQNSFMGCNNLSKIVVSGAVTINGYAVSNNNGITDDEEVLNKLRAFLSAPNVEFEAQ